MSDTNLSNEATLDALADICCDILTEGRPGQVARVNELIRSLVMSGYARQQTVPLGKEIETRVKASCGSNAAHRGAQLTAITQALDDRLSEMVRWEANVPEQSQAYVEVAQSEESAKPASISSIHSS